MKFRFHWGWAIGVFYSLFVIAMVYFVFYSQKVDHSLEVENYYDYDIGYEKLIGEKQRNSASLKVPVKIEYNENEKNVSIAFPQEFENVSGKIKFYRPNNKLLDKELAIKIDSLNIQRIDIQDFVSGVWKISAEWENNGKQYLDVNKFYFK